MKKFNTSLAALMLCAVTLMGAAGMAEARPGGPHHKGGQGYAAQMTPEARQMMEDACAKMAPLHLELRAKQAELTAKIYSGADDKTIQDLSNEVGKLQTQLNASRIDMQKSLAKAGVPMQYGMGGGGFHGGMGGGFHGGGMGMGGGFHGGGMGMGGGCPYAYGKGYAAPAPDAPSAPDAQ